MAGKREWPELVGKTGDEAKQAILQDRPDIENANIQVMPEDSMMTMDYREDRVRVMVDASGKVSKKPMVG